MYAVSLWAIADVVPAAGIITIDLVDGIGGTIIKDAQGVQNSISFDCTNLSTSWQHLDALVAAVNEVQQVSISGTPTGGTFTLTYDGQTTGTIAYNADAATVQAALEALSNIESGDVSATGGALPGTPVDIEFTGQLAAQDVPEMTTDGSGLTGGSSPDSAVATTTDGSSNDLAFRTPKVLPDLVYLRVRISTAVSSGTSVFIDSVALDTMTELYSGGPFVAIFGGSIDFKVGDLWTVTTTNDRAGSIQEAYNRNFNMARLGLLLPSKTNGAETVPDTVIA